MISPISPDFFGAERRDPPKSGKLPGKVPAPSANAADEDTVDLSPEALAAAHADYDAGNV